MNMDIDSTIWSGLPKDIVNYILLFDEKIKYRKGKYVNQLSKNSEIYNLLEKIPRPIYHTTYYIESLYELSVNFTDGKKKLYFMYFIKYNISRIYYYNNEKIDGIYYLL